MAASQPRTVAEFTGGLAATIGAYRIDEVAFADGLRFFHADRFVEARAAFRRADPATRDAVTQPYVACSYTARAERLGTTTRSTPPAWRRSIAPSPSPATVASWWTTSGSACGRPTSCGPNSRRG